MSEKMHQIVDSALAVHEILSQNPAQPCPDEILQTIGVMEVQYLSFDGEYHIGQMAVAQSVMAEVEAFFRQALESRFPIAKVVPASVYAWDDEALMADNVSSGFNYRFIAGSDKPSLHGRGLAFDINPVQNPYIRYTEKGTITQPPKAVWNPEKPGTLHADHPLVKLMEGFGWEWGGHLTPDSGRTDYQHFQKPN
jgi:hypothetical protein